MSPSVLNKFETFCTWLAAVDGEELGQGRFFSTISQFFSASDLDIFFFQDTDRHGPRHSLVLLLSWDRPDVDITHTLYGTLVLWAFSLAI